MGKSARWILAGTVGLLASVGVGASAAHYLQEPYNPGFLDFPTVVALHVVLGGVYLALAPFQFVKRIRSRHLSYHRWAGRLLVCVGLVVGATALFMGLVIPKGGWPERAVIGFFGIVFLFALIRGFLYQGLSLCPRAKGGAAQGVDDPGVRRRTRHRHDAPDLHPRAPDQHGRPDRRAVRDALGRVVGSGVRPTRLCCGALDPCHSQERRAYS
jgi:hypothetical protein